MDPEPDYSEPTVCHSELFGRPESSDEVASPKMDELKHRSSAVGQLPNETLAPYSTKDVES